MDNKKPESREEANDRLYANVPVVRAMNALLLAALECTIEEEVLSVPAANVLLGCVDDKTNDVLMQAAALGLIQIDKARGNVVLTPDGRKTATALQETLMAYLCQRGGGVNFAY